MQDNDSVAAVQPGAVYEAPVITRLGTLSELTLWGPIGTDDGLGGAGEVNSI